ncbi:MAG: hypothetical protein AAF830_13190 [Pseudomonadota bacterium]
MADDNNIDPRTAMGGAEGLPTGEMHHQSDEELKAQRKRNVAIALAVLAFALLVYATTFLRLAENLKTGTVE